MRIRSLLPSLLLMAAALTSGAPRAANAEQSIVVASTTSTQDSGLFGYLLPIVQARTAAGARHARRGQRIAQIVGH